MRSDLVVISACCLRFPFLSLAPTWAGLSLTVATHGTGAENALGAIVLLVTLVLLLVPFGVIMQCNTEVASRVHRYLKAYDDAPKGEEQQALVAFQPPWTKTLGS